MKKISTGIEDFKEMIDNNIFYVDKSDFIKVALSDKVTLFTRPRRFGKTLNMSMLYYFLSNKEKENAYLFNDLKIAKDEEIMAYQNQYPVIFITLKNMIDSSYEIQLDKFRAIINRIVLENKELLTSEYLDESEKNILENYRFKRASISELTDSLYNLTTYLEKHYQKKAVVLIDEYDVPLQKAYLHGYYDEMSNFIGSVFSSVFKSNFSLENGIMTGCLRIVKESIFTGLNNLKVYSIFNKGASSRLFGFSQEEINEVLRYYHLEAYQGKMQEWYDGYRFGSTEIYNPWSTLMYINQIINEEDDNPISFWANTSGNDIIYQYIQDSDESMRDEFTMLMEEKTLTKVIKPELTYREMDNIENIYSFLLFTGYLKTGKQLDMDTYELTIPNLEIKTIYQKTFSDWFREYKRSAGLDLYNALIDEDVIKANKVLNLVLRRDISYFDDYEAFYHGLVLGLLNNYGTISNRESGNGCYDIAVMPDSNKKRGIIIECKHTKKVENLKRESESAVKQIKEGRYFDEFLERGYIDIVGYGIAFCKKECYVTLLKD